ncbi:MAG: hypothetical protein WD845_10800 [Pirellulales bacterium]
MHGTFWQVMRVAALVAAIGVIDYALLRADVRYVASVQGALVVAALAVQVGLASVWAAIGRDQLAGRLPVLLAALAGVWWFLREWHPRAEREMATGFWLQAVIVIAALLFLRMVRFQTIFGPNAPVAGRRALLPRFSIRGVLLLTGMVCASLAIVLRMQSLRVQSDAMAISCIVGLFQASLTLAAVAATLIFRHVAVFVLLVCGGGAMVGWGIGRAIAYDELVATVSIAVPVSVQTAVLLAARLAGYRFVRAFATQSPGISEPTVMQAESDHSG